MPASLRAHLSRATSSRPYDRCSSPASPAQSGTICFSLSALPAPPIQAANPDVGANRNQDVDPDPDIPPDRPGLPTYAEYKRIEAAYLHSLSPRKRDKALITQAMFDKIWDVLHQPEACTIDTPQFRFWVRKMFTLSRPVGDAGGFGWSGNEAGTVAHALSDADLAALELERSSGIGIESATADELGLTAVVLHENRPVAVMEQLYELFCYCHVRAGHGGRDKTCAVIREHYSWVPKELTAQFVKACPTCVSKRSGHGSVAGIGVDIGLVAQKQVEGRGKKKGRATFLEVGIEEASVPVGSLGLGWPTTGGPLDPGNPEPCGVRKRKRERECLRAREDVASICPPSPLSPVPGSTVGSMSGGVSLKSPGSGWSVFYCTPTLDTLPYHPGGATFSHSFKVKGVREEKENCSPAKTQLPSLASALSNESLDNHVDLAGPQPGGAAECLLPPALRPLRLRGPMLCDTGPNLAEPSPHSSQIDPMLLPFNYPGLGLCPRPGFASDTDAEDPVSLGLRNDSDPALSEEQGIMSIPGHDFYRLRTSSDSVRMNLPALEPSRELDSPDSSFERAAGYAAADGVVAATLPFSLSTEFVTRGRCGSRYGYRDGPFAMLYHCSGDEVDQELDGSLSFSIMTDV